MSARKFMVTIVRECWEAMHYWCKKSSPNEVGGVAQVEHIGASLLRVHTPELLPQEVSPGGVDFQAQPVQRWLENLFGADRVNVKIPNLTWCFWHTHPTFGVCWSTTDEEWIHNFVNAGLLVSLCINDKGEYAYRVDTNYMGNEDMHIELPCSATVLPHTAKETEALDEQFKAMVTKREYAKFAPREKDRHDKVYYTSSERGKNGEDRGYFDPRDDAYIFSRGSNSRLLLPAKEDKRADSRIDDLPMSEASLAAEKRRLKWARKMLAKGDKDVFISFPAEPGGKLELTIGKNMINLDPTNAARSIISQFTGISMKDLASWIVQGGVEVSIPATKGGKDA